MWSKLDDGFFRNRKARAAGKDGRALYIAGLCWCGAQLSDGVIAASDLQLIAAEAEVNAKRTARRLVDVGLWEEVDEGWVVHDYHDYNPTAEAELEKRRVRAEAGRKGGLRSRPPRSKPEPPGEPNPEAFASAESKQIGTPSPSPSLTADNPQSSSTVRGTAGDGRRDRVEAAVLELARRDVERYTAAGGSIRTPGRYLARCADSRRRDDAPRLYELAHDHPDWTPLQLADGAEPTITAAPCAPRPPDWTPPDHSDALDPEAGTERIRALRAGRQPAPTA